MKTVNGAVVLSKMIYQTLSNGKKIPMVGLGTWKGETGKIYQAVKQAIEVGYRHIDCAHVYGNEGEIGTAINEMIGTNQVKRQDLFVVSKLWMTYTRPDRVIKCIQKSLSDLKLKYLDLYLIHWPISLAQQDKELFPIDSNGKIMGEDVDICQTWKAMEDLVAKDLAKSIGISNFNSKQIDRILKTAKIKPVINQIEVHPYLPQQKLIEFCNQKGIAVTAYSPLGGQFSNTGQEKKNLMEENVVKKLADKYRKNGGQILIRFAIDRNISCVPKSTSKERLASNIQVFDFKLTNEEVKQLEELDCNHRVCILDIPGIKNVKEYPFVGNDF